VARNCDDHGDVGSQRALYQIAQALAVSFSLAEPVDNQQIGTSLQCAGDPGARILEPADIQPTSARGGIKILRKNLFFPTVEQHGQQAGVGALTRLHHANGAKAAGTEISRELAQDSVGILMVVIDQRSKLAFNVEHGVEPGTVEVRSGTGSLNHERGNARARNCFPHVCPRVRTDRGSASL
jgi:hypothetical protein